MEQLADRFPFLFSEDPGGERETGATQALVSASGLEDRLLGVLNALTLAHFFHRIGHLGEIHAPIRDVLRRHTLRNGRRLQQVLLDAKPEAWREMFHPPGDSEPGRWCEAAKEYGRILRRGDAGGLAEFLAGSFRSEIHGLSTLEERGPGGQDIADLAFDPAASHRIELRLEDGVQVPLFPFLAVGQDGRPYLFRGFDGLRAEYQKLDGSARRTSRDPAVRKCLAEYLLQMASYSDSRRIFDGLRAGETRTDHRGLWAAVYGSLGDRFFRQGRYSDAARILERSLLHRPNIPEARFQLWEAYRKLGKLQEAEQVILPVLERYPNLEQAHAMLEKTREAIRRGDGRDTLAVKSGTPPPRGGDDSNRTSPIPNRKPETTPARSRREPGGRSGRQRIAEYLIDLTAEATGGQRPDLIGREREMEEILQVLTCRDKRNPLLVGDAGVGKTALVEELARRLVSDALPDSLRGKRILTLNQASLLAGAKYRGEFEERMLEILNEVRETDSILFLDHVHTMVQPPHSRGGSMDAGGLLKGPLIRGEIQVVATTTFEDQQNSLDKDPTLSRCFQRIRIDEPDSEETRQIMLGSCTRYEVFHQVGFESDSLYGSLEAIQRYLPEGNLPDKALDVVDRAAARVSLEAASGLRSDRVVREKDLLLTIAEMARIPSSRVSQGFRHNLLGLEGFLEKRIIGQPAAVETVTRVLRSATRGLKLNPDRPNGVFLFLGPTGVGKTELARAMSEGMFGGRDGLIRIDMSEYMDRISTSRLIGAAPGYVGYNDLNQLTDKVRRRPYCLILLDEVEKADPQTMQLFLQVFDAGRLTDGRGRTVSFGATTIVMTTNLGSELYTRSAVGYSHGETPDRASRETLRKELMNRFSPEFLNRIDEFVFFRRLSETDVQAIAGLQLQAIHGEMSRQGKRLDVDDGALEWLARRGYSPIWGARDLGRCLRREILDPVARISLSPEWSRVDRIHVGRDGDRLEITCWDEDRPLTAPPVSSATAS